MSRQDSRKVSDVKVMLLKGADGSSIADIELTSSVLNVDTYAITLTDGSKTSFQVTNGVSIEDIQRTGVEANVDTYTIYLSDGSTSTFTVTNGRDTHAQMAERVTSPATLAYAVGDYVTFNDLFCEVTAPIAVGDTFAIGTNLNATTVGDEMETIKSSISALLDLFYPVGTIYESTNSNFNPNTTWGGTWSKIEGRFLLGSSQSYSIGSTGGESEHTLTIDEMPSHNHKSSDWAAIVTTINRAQGDASFNGILSTLTETRTSTSTGSDQAHNNMPPYQVVNIWKRTA